MPLLSASGRTGQQPAASKERANPCLTAPVPERRWAIARGKIPYQTPSNRTILQSVADRRRRRYVVLADAAGRLTPAGVWYYERTGAQMPCTTFSQDQELPCRGDELLVPPTDNTPIQSLRSAARPEASRQ